ncbi:hypothetical protein I4F81_000384 [Pyropia yezoensis]|uniref:Uncharacterized protein n=1 Tax=Pyropia yezoensis TaxID=2788 RepID=A0ACC3BJ23_PYRYE|nr:hypothetical protein I4F81_000384 [Neopyropia yezoensis]
MASLRTTVSAAAAAAARCRAAVHGGSDTPVGVAALAQRPARRPVMPLPPLSRFAASVAAVVGHPSAPGGPSVRAAPLSSSSPPPPPPPPPRASAGPSGAAAGGQDGDSGGGSDGGTTHFGAEEVPLHDKARRVSGVFSSVAASYDTMNDAMSLGVHRLWKDAFVRMLSPVPGMAVVDLAGGTGDIAFRVVSALDAAGAWAPSATAATTPPVRVLDINPDMLAEGVRRAASAGIPPSRATFAIGNAEALPLPDASVDALTISFGMRNVSRPAVALAEAVRVLAPGGRFLMMEFGRVRHPVAAAAYDAYSAVLPAVGAVVAGDAPAYRYLVESIRRFPGQEAFCGMMREAGLQRVRVTDLTGGVVAVYSGWKGVARPR